MPPPVLPAVLPLTVLLLKVNVPVWLKMPPPSESAVLPHRIFWSVVLPLVVPGLVATFLFVLVFAWNEYLLALFLSGAKVQTLPYVISSRTLPVGRSGRICRC